MNVMMWQLRLLLKKGGLFWDCWRSIGLKKKKMHICVLLSKGFFKCQKFWSAGTFFLFIIITDKRHKGNVTIWLIQAKSNSSSCPLVSCLSYEHGNQRKAVFFGFFLPNQRLFQRCRAQFVISASVCADYSPAKKGVRESRLGKVGLRRGEVTPCCLTYLLSPAVMGTAVAGAVWDWRGRLVRSACPSLPLTGLSAGVVVERFRRTPPP